MSSFSFSFRSDRPDLATPGKDSTNPGEVAMALAYEKALRSPAYLNQNDPGHYKALEDVEKFGRALYGEEPVGGRSFSGHQTISSADGAVIDPAVQMQQAMHPRHAEYLAGRMVLNNDNEVT